MKKNTDNFISWFCADTHVSISNRHSFYGAFPVYFLTPNEYGGETIVERNYEGYGIFNGVDALHELGKWNLEHYLSTENKKEIRRTLNLYIKDKSRNIFYNKNHIKRLMKQIKNNNIQDIIYKKVGKIYNSQIINCKYPLKITEFDDWTYEELNDWSDTCIQKGYFYKLLDEEQDDNSNDGNVYYEIEVV